MKWFGSAGAVLLVGMMVGDVTAEILYTLASPNEEQDGRFGHSVAGAGDVNGDGCDDIVVGAYYEDPGLSPAGAGRAYIFDGRTGGLLHTLVSPNQEEFGWFGNCVAGVGDVDGDGYDDVVIGAVREGPGGEQRAGRAYAFSGNTGEPIHTLVSAHEEEYSSFGCSVAGSGDVDGDGCADILVGAHLEDGGGTQDAGCAYVFSGQTAEVLHVLLSPEPEVNGQFGFAVSGAGDANNDGRSDLVIGAFYEEPVGSPEAVGRVYVFNGLTGGLLHSLTSPNEQEEGHFGWFVSGGQDANGDGCADVIVGAPYEDLGPGLTDAGRAYVFDGRTGALLHTLASPTAEAHSYMGLELSGAGDVDADGYHDVIVGAYKEAPGDTPNWGGRAHVFSGASGGALYSLASPNEELSGLFGCSVAGAGDVNHDGVADVVVGASKENPGASPEDAGRAYVITPAFISADPPRGPCLRSVALLGPFPNPTTGGVVVVVRVAKEASGEVELNLYDGIGRRVASTLPGFLRGGTSLCLRWRTSCGISPGVYWWHLRTRYGEARKAMVVVR